MSGQCVVWDWKKKRPVQSIGNISRDPFVVQLTADGRDVVVADHSHHTLHVRSVSPPAETLQLLGHRNGFKGAKFIDSETIVSAGTEGVIRVWNAVTGQELKTIPTGATCLEVAASPDGRMIATATTKGVMLWDRATGKVLHHWKDMEETWFIRFSKQGQILAATGKKGIIRLWSTQDGRELHSLQLSSGVHGFALSEDGSQVIAQMNPGCEFTLWNAVRESGCDSGLRGDLGTQIAKATSQHSEQCFSKAIELVPDKTKYWHEYAYRLAFLRAYLEKWDSYHELCTKALEDFGDTPDEKLAERTSKMCLFSDRISVDREKAGGLADRAWGNRKQSTILRYTEMALGIADMRRDNYEKAVTHFVASIQGLLKSSYSESVVITSVKLYLAIAYKRLSRHEDAKRMFEEATSELKSTPEPFSTWNDWMNAKIVWAEAKSILQP